MLTILTLQYNWELSSRKYTEIGLSYQTLKSKLNIYESLKLQKLLISSFFLCFLMNRHHSDWLLGFLAAVTLRAAAAELDVY